MQLSEGSAAISPLYRGVCKGIASNQRSAHSLGYGGAGMGPAVQLQSLCYSLYVHRVLLQLWPLIPRPGYSPRIPLGPGHTPLPPPLHPTASVCLTLFFLCAKCAPLAT